MKYILLMILFFEYSFCQMQTTCPFFNDTDVPGLYPEASIQILNSDSLYKISEDDLSIMRNEIFARHGYKFNSEIWDSYFNRLEWYTPKFEDVNKYLSEIEKENINIIKSVEKIIKDKNKEHWGSRRIYCYKFSQKDSLVTISDSTYRFKLSFPSSWVLKNLIKPSKQVYYSISIQNDNSSVNNSENSNLGKNNGVGLKIWWYPEYKDIREWYEHPIGLPQKQAKERLKEVKEIKIGGKNVLAYKPSSEVIWFIYNGLLYQMSYTFDDNNSEIICKKIIESFAFI